VRNLTRYLLWAYVFTVPWDNFALPLVGTISRAFGLVVVGASVLTIAGEGRVRKPDAVLGFAIAFSVWSVFSLLWTVDYEKTVVTIQTVAQLAASVWMIREFVRTREDVQPLLAALLFGLFVPLADLLNNFRLGVGIEVDSQRFSAVGLNADAVGLFLVLGLPIAWHLLMHRRGIVSAVALIYVVTAPVGLMLTATRGALVAGLAALAIVPITLFRQSLRSYALAGVLLILSALSALQFVPQYNWERMGSTVSQIMDRGNMSGRTELWNASLQAFPQRPLVGAGAGAYVAAITPYFGGAVRAASAHNVVIGLLVEHGIIGLTLFAALFGACAWTVFRSPPPHGALWGVLILTWLVGAMSGNLEGLKLTWVLFGLISAQSGLIVAELDRPTAAGRGSNAVSSMQFRPNAAGVARRQAAGA
jgi:O-antigen ligase